MLALLEFQLGPSPIEAERDFLRKEIYRWDIDIEARRIDAYDRYSDCA